MYKQHQKTKTGTGPHPEIPKTREGEKEECPQKKWGGKIEKYTFLGVRKSRRISTGEKGKKVTGLGLRQTRGVRPVSGNRK